MANFMLSRIPQLRDCLINVDPFGDLLLVDLHQTEDKQLQRYMGRDGHERYLAAQHQTAACV